tara:strand:- start:27843 stop:28367 length:525 start_codon:yes stop_codon:yes gene_type:complete
MGSGNNRFTMKFPPATLKRALNVVEIFAPVLLAVQQMPAAWPGSTGAAKPRCGRAGPGLDIGRSIQAHDFMPLGEHVAGEGIDRCTGARVSRLDNPDTHPLEGKFMKEFRYVWRFGNGNAHIDQSEIEQHTLHIVLLDGSDNQLDRVDRRQPVLVAVKNDLDIARCAVWNNATE